MNRLNVELSPELEVYREQIEATIKPYVQIKLTDNDKPTLWQSKFGGLPYLPKGYDYPKAANGDYLYLLAQINFAEVPTLEGFPDKGILQFFIAPSDSYGLDYDDPKLQNTFRVVYFADVEKDETNLVTDFSFLPEIEDIYTMPFEGCCQVTFQSGYAPISAVDYKFDLFPLFEDGYEEIAEEYFDKFCLEQHQLGGYPNFTQDDPRGYREENQESYILLFQMCSERNEAIDICWGDVGIANFFTRPSDMAKRDFTSIWYNWDCT